MLSALQSQKDTKILAARECHGTVFGQQSATIAMRKCCKLVSVSISTRAVSGLILIQTKGKPTNGQPLTNCWPCLIMRTPLWTFCYNEDLKVCNGF